jgi:hypothetical protein
MGNLSMAKAQWAMPTIDVYGEIKTLRKENNAVGFAGIAFTLVSLPFNPSAHIRGGVHRDADVS